MFLCASILAPTLSLSLLLGNLILQAAAQGKWPDGTQVYGSTTAQANGTYDAIHALDNNLCYFWNDATMGQFPDTLTLIPPSPINLVGVSVISDGAGWITAYSVDGYFENGSWVKLASLSDIPVLLSTAFFQQPYRVLQLRINVGDAMINETTVPLFTRVNEVFPHYANGTGIATIPSTAQGSPANSSSKVGSSSHHSEKPTIIVGSALGAIIVLSLLAALAAFKISRRNRQGQSQVLEERLCRLEKTFEPGESSSDQRTELQSSTSPELDGLNVRSLQIHESCSRSLAPTGRS